MRRRFLLAPLLCLLLGLLPGCGAGGDPPTPRSSPAASFASPDSAATNTATTAPAPPILVPPDGRAWFGMNLDWANQTIPEVTERLGATPAVWVQFVRFPLGDGDRANLEGFFEQVGAAGALGLVTLEPHGGLGAVTAEAAAQLAEALHEAWATHGVPTFVRFAHEMNGSWYPWGQQPDEYVAAFRLVADAVHAGAPASAMVWAPNDGAGYPFHGGAFEAEPGSAARAALDTDGDGDLTAADDPYAPFWPGEDAVDWVGMSLYFWGLEYPWGENELAPAGRFAAQLTGTPTGAHEVEPTIPDFYATYADGYDRPMAIVETAALFDPAAPGADEAAIKGAWFRQVVSAQTRAAFPRIGMINWFEWRKEEREVGSVVDWRLTADAAIARALLEEAPDGWLLFADE